MKILVTLLAILLFAGSFLSYLLTRSILPWNFIDGIICPLTSSSCALSFKIFSYYYWINKAIKNKDIGMCDNISGKETFDVVGDSKQSAITDCRIVFIIKTEDVNLCLTSIYKNTCLKGLAKRLNRQDLCERINFLEDKSFAERQISTCKDNINKNKNNDIIAY